MKDTTLSKLGGICSLLTGVTLIVTAVLYLLLPSEQQDACGCPDRLLASLAHNSTLYVVDYAVLGLYPLLAIAAVLAISANVRAVHDGWVRWTSTLAIIGLAVTAIDAIRHAALDPAKATAYVQGDAAVKAALTVPGALEGLDPQGWLRAGAVGFWILVVSLLALRGGTWPTAKCRKVSLAGSDPPAANALPSAARLLNLLQICLRACAWPGVLEGCAALSSCEGLPSLHPSHDRIQLDHGPRT